MSKLDEIVERLRGLPEADLDAVAAEIDSFLRGPVSALTPAQWRAVDLELAASDDDVNIPHAAVLARLRRRFGR